MTSSRPYLLRALHEWILDNGLTPYILIDAYHENVQVPVQYVNEGRIVLNITPGIISELEISNEDLQFNARFSGVLQHIYAPISAVLAIYSKENGKGMVFPQEDSGDDLVDPSPSPKIPPKRKPTLKVIK
jgi:stringent starvation protein B